jgi:RND family efflux transporter MFP subunit
LERAKRAHALAVNRHEYCVLRAEANGVVTSVMGDVGEVVTEGRPIVRIAQTDEMEAVIHLPENRAKIEKGYVAHATVWAESNSDYQVSLRELSPIADAATRTYQAKFTIHNPGSDIALGRTITLRLATTSVLSKFEVPLTAIHQQGSAPAVWRVDNDHLISVPISIDSYREDSALVSHGVASGDLIVAAGVQKLDPAVRVQAWGEK